MALEYQILLAVILDLLLGDPRRFPHPVKLMGLAASALEAPCRSAFRDARTAGVAVVGLVVVMTVAVTYALIEASRWVHPVVGDVVSVLVLYTGLAARDLVDHSVNVLRSLQADDLPEARKRVGMICGRDVDSLDGPGITRAAVESVAENLVDGVTAPLFFAVLGGPVCMMAYKAVSTLDSIFGYKDDRYREFGWASARLDDAAAFIPSRITALMVPFAALLLGHSFTGAVRVFLRDRNKHTSPNAGQCEAATAGALGIRLGGLSYYRGVPSDKPTLGDPLRSTVPDDIFRANGLMLMTMALTLVLFLSLRLLVMHTAG